MSVKKIPTPIIALLMIILLCAAIPAAAAGDSMFRANLQRTGVYDNGGIEPNNQELWSFPSSNVVVSSPTVANGVVYFGSWDFHVYALNALTRQAAWNQPFATGNWVSSSPAVVNGVVYVSSYDGNIYAINAATGTQQWSFTTTGGTTWISSSPAVVDGVVYVGSHAGNVYAIKTVDGTAAWSQPFVAGAVLSSPAVANGVVYVGSYDSNVYAINADTGLKIWDFPTGGAVHSTPAVANGVVYVGSYDNKVYAINADSGTKKWEFETDDAVVSSPAFANGVVYVGSNDNKVYAINADSGTKKWEFETGDDVVSSPAFANGVVYVGSYDKKLYALNADTSAKLWEFATFAKIQSSPAVANGVVYVASYDDDPSAPSGKVYAIGQPQLQTTLTASAAVATVAVTRPISITGRLTTSTSIPVAGATIQLQKYVNNAWQDVTGKTATTTAEGTYTIIVTEPTANTYRYRTVYAGDSTHQNSLSTEVTVKVVSKASVQQDLATLRTTLNNLPNSAFYPGTKSALIAVLNAAELQLQYNKYGDAAYTLQSKFLVRTDGCALRGTPDTTDLVRTCAAQGQLYPQVLNLIQELQALQGS